jgi:hypothetical protein
LKTRLASAKSDFQKLQVSLEALQAEREKLHSEVKALQAGVTSRCETTAGRTRNAGARAARAEGSAAATGERAPEDEESHSGGSGSAPPVAGDSSAIGRKSKRDSRPSSRRARTNLSSPHFCKRSVPPRSISLPRLSRTERSASRSSGDDWQNLRTAANFFDLTFNGSRRPLITGRDGACRFWWSLITSDPGVLWPRSGSTRFWSTSAKKCRSGEWAISSNLKPPPFPPFRVNAVGTGSGRRQLSLLWGSDPG